jgi:orotate phosphoribosyltransferase
MPDDDKRLLLGCLADYAYEHRPEGFVLASGMTSTEYLDCRAALSHGEALPVLGRTVAREVVAEAVAVGGLTMGADPIAVSTSLVSGRLRWFSVRKEPKKHGTKKMIEGDVAKGAAVVVVDDVVTSGGSTIEAIQKCRAADLRVVQVIVLVDREESAGMARVRAEAGEGVPVVALFTKSEVAAEWRRRRAPQS